jgi:hypothetical protein
MGLCLFKRRLAQRTEGSADASDPIAQAFKPLLPRMLCSVAKSGGSTPEVRAAAVRTLMERDIDLASMTDAGASQLR